MILINRQVNNHYSMGGTHFLQTGYLLLNRNAPFLEHSKMLQCFRNGFFLIRRALRLFSILGLGLVVIHPLNNAVFLLYLCDIKTTDLQTAAFQNIILDLPIGCQSSFILHHFFHIHINVDMCYRISQN